MSGVPAAFDPGSSASTGSSGSTASTASTASTDSDSGERPARARRTVLRSVKILAFLFALNYLVLPQIAGARKAASELLTLEPVYLVVGLAFQGAALLAYTQLTRACLPPGSVPFFTLFRIQLSTKAVTNVVPGGTAAGSALGYRLMTTSGVRGADAGFALATAGLGSAVMLNLLLWLGLLFSIPTQGLNPLYITAAVVGMVMLTGGAFVVIGLMKGQERAERVLRALARRVKWLDEEHVGLLVRRLAKRLRELLTDRQLVCRVALWAALNWLLDAVSLWVFLRAFGWSTSFVGLLVSFCLANVFGALPITPGGLGIIEGIMIPTLVGFGVPRSVALVGVPMYRLAQFWLPIPVGALAYLSLRVGPFSIDRTQRLPGLRTEVKQAATVTERNLEWIDRYGARPRDGDDSVLDGDASAVSVERPGEGESPPH